MLLHAGCHTRSPTAGGNGGPEYEGAAWLSRADFHSAGQQLWAEMPHGQMQSGVTGEVIQRGGCCTNLAVLIPALNHRPGAWRAFGAGDTHLLAIFLKSCMLSCTIKHIHGRGVRVFGSGFLWNCSPQGLYHPSPQRQQTWEGSLGITSSLS